MYYKNNNILKIASYLLIILYLLSICSCKNITPEIYIFSNIDECKNIEKYKKADAIIENYDSPENDSNIKDLNYENFFGCNYSDSDINFEIFAYEFNNYETAKLYFKNETGKSTDNNADFLESTGMTKSKRIVIYDNRAYYIQTEKENFEKVKEFINNCFTEKITFDTTESN